MRRPERPLYPHDPEPVRELEADDHPDLTPAEWAEVDAIRRDDDLRRETVPLAEFLADLVAAAIVCAAPPALLVLGHLVGL